MVDCSHRLQTHLSDSHLYKCSLSSGSTLALTLICAWQGKLSSVNSTFSPILSITSCLGINPCHTTLFCSKPMTCCQPHKLKRSTQLGNHTYCYGCCIFKQTIRRQDWVACALSYFGVIVIATKGDILSMTFDSPPLGLALLSTLLWAGTGYQY